MMTPGQKLVGTRRGLGGMTGDQGGSPRLRMKCSYKRGGVCSVHGQAVKKFRPGHELVVGPDGGMKKRYVKKTFWVCDLNQMGDKKLKQPVLSLMMTQNDRKGGDDSPVAMGGGTSSSSTSKEGQNKSYEHVAGCDVSQEISL